MKFIIIAILCPILSFAQSADDITGVWRVISNSWNTDTKQYADCEIIKFITDTRWASLMYWEETGEFAGSGGGTYKWIDDQYIETAEYYSWDSSAVGSTQAYGMTIQNNLLVQQGKLNTDKYKYPLYTVYQKIDDLSHSYSINDTPQGIWQLCSGTYGKEVLKDKDAIEAKYGAVIKIITPKYFIGTFFNEKDSSFIGVTFGTHKFKKSKYTEMIKFWSWEDKSMIGAMQSFDWVINDRNQYVQKGMLDSESYDKYLIEEKYERIEHLQLKDKLWTAVDLQTVEEIHTRKVFTDYIDLINQDDWADHIAPYLRDVSFIQDHENFRSAFTNYNATIKHMTVEGNYAMAWMIIKARHEGIYTGLYAGKESQQIEPTNKDLEWEEAWYFNVEGNKFGAAWDFMSQDLSRMRQMGVTEVPED